MERKSQFSLACSRLSKMVKEKQGSFGTWVDKRTEDAMTIFYGGSVFVFDSVAEERAKDLMQMASNADTAVAAADGVPARVLAQTRRASLHRFLNRRKDRISVKAPYDVSRKMEAMAKSESRSWLSLGQEMTAREAGEWLNVCSKFFNEKIHFD